MISRPNIVFCITNKGRTQHLELTLSKNLSDNEYYPNCKFVILDYNSTDYLGTYLLSRHGNEMTSGRLAVYSMLPPAGSFVPFRMAHAKNMAHRCGILEGADILVNLDADNYTGYGFANHIAERMYHDTYLFANMVKGEMTRGISGRIAVTTQAFLKTGGYDEAKFNGWGSDDKDFNLRLQVLGYRGSQIDGVHLVSVPHNDKVRFREYPHLANCSDDYFEVNKGTITWGVVNRGEIGCGVVYKNFDFNNPIELCPIPTRVFGIGMHKTATTSLHTAFGVLGYDSWHWRSAHEAKAIWDEIACGGRSLTLERYYALCDLPIPALYKELDRAYPGSKFILTVRDDVSWLDSVRRHWSQSTNKFRKDWNDDPFTHQIHKEIYGQRNFDSEIFLERYRSHNLDVMEYFRDRPSDLLVFESDGWSRLCNFLGRPVPLVRYPRRYSSVS